MTDLSDGMGSGCRAWHPASLGSWLPWRGSSAGKLMGPVDAGWLLGVDSLERAATPGYDGPASKLPRCLCCRAGVPSKCHLSCCRQPLSWWWLIIFSSVLSLLPPSSFIVLLFCVIDFLFPGPGSQLQLLSSWFWLSEWLQGMDGSLSKSLKEVVVRLILCPLADPSEEACRVCTVSCHLKMTP